MKTSNLFLYSFLDGHLDCIHLGPIINEIAMNIPVQIFLRKCFKFCLGKFLRVEFLGHMVNVSLTFQETVEIFQGG